MFYIWVLVGFVVGVALAALVVHLGLFDRFL